MLYLKCMYQFYRLFSGLVRNPTPHLTPHRTLFSDDNFLLFYCKRKHAAAKEEK